MPERARASDRIEQPAHPADVRVVGYGPDDVPVVPDEYADLPVHQEKSGHVDHWNPDLMDPEPSSVYVVDDRYLYVTDTHGRVLTAQLSITSDGHLATDFDYDTLPDWSIPVDRSSYTADLSVFPRDPENTPGWMRG